MKTLAVFGFGMICAASLAAQSRALSRPLGVLAPVPRAGALGGNYVSPVISRPLGGVALPTFGPPTQKKKAGPAAATRVGSYVGPVYYTPNPFDTASYSDYSTGYLPQPVSQQPIVVNQYFVSRGADIPGAPQPAPPMVEEAPVINPGDPLTPPQNYYLIAYRNHSVYSALAYWLEGDTLHYVTTQNTHNQATLSLIDIDQTYKLNSDQSVPFSIPGR